MTESEFEPGAAGAAVAVPFHLEGQTLVVDDPEQLKALDRERWSPSSSKTLQKCPSRWVAERVLEGEPDPFDPAPLGTAAHLVLEVLYGLPVGERTLERIEQIVSVLDTEYADERFDLVIPEGLGDVIRWKAAVLEKLAGLFRAEDPSKVLVAGLERALDTASVNGVPFKGRIDRTDFLTDEQQRIVGSACRDYKSGMPKTEYARRKFGDDHGDQLRLYALALENLDGRVPDEVSIIYTATGDTYTATLDRRNLDRVAEEFRATWDEMKESARTGRYRMGAGPLCGWCPLATVCPAAAAAGKDTAKVEGATLGERLGVVVLPSPDEQVAVAQTAVEPPAAVVVAVDDDGYVPDADHGAAPDIDGVDASTGGVDMTNKVIADGKAWDPQVGGLLNGTSYTAGAVFGLVGYAVELLHAQEQKTGQPMLSKQNVTALAQTLASIVERVQLELSGEVDLQHGIHTRLRGALRETIPTLPVPFGAPPADWEAWVGRVARRIKAFSEVAVDLYARGSGEEPWLPLAGQADEAWQAAS